MCQDEGDAVRENCYRAALASYTTHAMKGTVQGVLFDSFEKVSAVYCYLCTATCVLLQRLEWNR